MPSKFDFRNIDLDFVYEKFGIAEGAKETFEGTITISDNNVITDYIMREYMLELREVETDVPLPTLADNQGCLSILLSKPNQDKKETDEPQEEITPHQKFLTRTEFNTVFDKSIGLQLDAELARAEKKQQNIIKKLGESEESFEEAENAFYKIMNAFYQLYPAYALFNITSEIDRTSLERALTSIDGETDQAYFYAMEASNPQMADFFLKQRRIKIAEHERRKHAILLASTGSGKSELLKTFIRQHINYEETAIVVFDPKADFAKQIAMFRENAWASRQDKLVYIDPELSNDKVPVINPFDVDLRGLSSDEIDKIAQGVFASINVLFQEKKHETTANMEMILLPIVHTLLRKEDGCLADIYRFLNDKDNADLVELGKQSPNEAISYFFKNRWDDFTYKPSKDGLEKRIFNLITVGGFGKLTTGKTSIDLKKAIDEKKLIIFNLSKGVLTKEFSEVFGKFLLITLSNIIFSRAKLPKHKRTPCHIYIDEFHNYTSAALEELFTEGRGLGAYLTVATQTTGQNLTEQARKKVMGNCNVKVIGLAGKDTRREMQAQMEIDSETAKFSGIDKRTLSKLKTGEFVIKVGANLPFKVKNRTHTLDNRHNMKREYWDKIVDEQIDKYYVKPTPFSLKSPDKRSEGHNSPTPSKTNEKNTSRNNKKDNDGGRKPFSPKFDA